VHEQRDKAQPREGVVGDDAAPASSRRPAQSLIDRDRADWEGMAPAKYEGDAEAPAGPRPGANSLAGGTPPERQPGPVPVQPPKRG